MSLVCCCSVFGQADSVAVQSGNDQFGIKNETLPDSLLLVVFDALGNPVNGQVVQFLISSKPVGAAGQSLSTSSDVSDVNGKAGTLLTLGNKFGTYQVKAGIVGIDTVTFSFTALSLKTTILRIQRELEDLINENIKLIVAHEAGITRQFTTRSGQNISFKASPNAATKLTIRAILKNNYSAMSAKSIRIENMIP